MARYRTIHCLIWNDDKFPYVSDDCQLVFFHILTTPLSSPFGLYKASLEMLASEKRWPVKRYAKAFQEGYAKGFFKYDQKSLVLLIPNFVKYNLPDNPKVLQSWGKIYEEIPLSALKTEFYSIFKGYLEQYRKGFLIQFDISFGKGIGYLSATATDSERERESQEREREESKNSLVGNFKKFWEVYPRKVAKPSAEKAWKKLNPNEELLATILSAVEVHSKSPAWKKDDKQFIPHPATWLNQRRWEDETRTEEPWEPPEVRALRQSK